jgi:hypothetical protein
MPPLEAIDREAKRLVILRDCLRGTAVDPARELIEHDDERES